MAKYEIAVIKVQSINPYDLISVETAESPIGANGIPFLSYLLGERVLRWNPNTMTAQLGLKIEDQHCDLFRAILEEVTLSLNIILGPFRQNTSTDELLVVGGDAKDTLWCQMMTGVYNARVRIPVLLEEAISMGAVVTDGVGVGVFRGSEVISQIPKLDHTAEPDPEAVAAYGPVKEASEVYCKTMLSIHEYMTSHRNT